MVVVAEEEAFECSYRYVKHETVAYVSRKAWLKKLV